MTSAPEEQVRQVLDELLPGTTHDEVTTDQLKSAGQRFAVIRIARHRVMHAEAQRGGALVWAMRERGMSWREIYDATGIVQRTAGVWRDLFLQEGLTELTDDELNTRAKGDQS
jgi:hypothetical protein